MPPGNSTATFIENRTGGKHQTADDKSQWMPSQPATICQLTQTGAKGYTCNDVGESDALFGRRLISRSRHISLTGIRYESA
jgi:hypothetical protein